MVNTPRDSDRLHDFVQCENGSVTVPASTGVCKSTFINSVVLNTLSKRRDNLSVKVANNVCQECVHS